MRPIVHFGGETSEGDAFFGRCMAAAAALADAGAGPGDVVALMLRNEPVLLEAMLAARWIGVRACLVNWHFKEAEVRHILVDSGARVLIAHADLLARIGRALPAGLRVFVVAPHEHTCRVFALDEGELPTGAAESWQRFVVDTVRPVPAAQAPGAPMVYTSGTTGLPKGIRRNPATPEQVEHLAARSRIVLGFEPGARAYLGAPMYHSAPATYAVQAALADAELWIEPRFDAAATLGLIESARLTHLYLVPTMYVRLLRLDAAVRRRHDLSSVRFVASTGSPCPVDIKRAMIDWWGPVFHESYAASELGWVTHIDSIEALRRPGSAGRANPGVLLKVLSAAGQELPAGTVGLVHARDPAVPDFTYANNDAARRAIERDGLWTLGDLGRLDAEGYLYIVDRQADMVISGGVNIYPAEIEAVLTTLPGVVDCAVFGVPDGEFGEALVAAVQPVPGAHLDASTLRALLGERLAGFKVPRVFAFHDELPREESGKIFKRKLREEYHEAKGGA